MPVLQPKPSEWSLSWMHKNVWEKDKVQKLLRCEGGEFVCWITDPNTNEIKPYFLGIMTLEEAQRATEVHARIAEAQHGNA